MTHLYKKTNKKIWLLTNASCLFKNVSFKINTILSKQKKFCTAYSIQIQFHRSQPLFQVESNVIPTWVHSFLAGKSNQHVTQGFEGEITKSLSPFFSPPTLPSIKHVQVSRWNTSKATYLPRSLGQTWSLAQAPSFLKELQLQNHVPWTRYCNCRLCCLLYLWTFLPQQQEESSLNYWFSLFPL